MNSLIFQDIVRACKDKSRTGQHHEAAQRIKLPVLPGWAEVSKAAPGAIVEWIGRADGEKYGYAANFLVQSIPLQPGSDPIAIVDAAVAEIDNLTSWSAIDPVVRISGDPEFASLSGIAEIDGRTVRIMVVYALYSTPSVDLVSLTASASTAQFDDLRGEFSEIISDSATRWMMDIYSRGRAND